MGEDSIVVFVSKPEIIDQIPAQLSATINNTTVTVPTSIVPSGLNVHAVPDIVSSRPTS